MFLRNFKVFKSTFLTFLLFVTTIIDLGNSATTTNSNQIQVKRTPKFFQDNCTCSTQWQCECCAKVNNDLLNVHQKLCADWKIFSNSWDIKANVRLNDNILYTNTFSAWNIPPFCVPIWPALALTGCIQIHSVMQHEFNTLHGCANVTMNFITFNLINWQMGCMDVGAQGIQFVEPDHQVVNESTSEKPPEIELETSDLIKIPPIQSHFKLNEDDNGNMRSTSVLSGSLIYSKNKDLNNRKLSDFDKGIRIY